MDETIKALFIVIAIVLSHLAMDSRDDGNKKGAIGLLILVFLAVMLSQHWH